MSGDRESALSFPCAFPIKAMGTAGEAFEATVLEIVGRHAPIPAGGVTRRPSRGGKYLSVTVTIEATSRAQLDAIYRELHACDRVVMAL